MFYSCLHCYIGFLQTNAIAGLKTGSSWRGMDREKRSWYHTTLLILYPWVLLSSSWPCCSLGTVLSNWLFCGYLYCRCVTIRRLRLEAYCHLLNSSAALCQLRRLRMEAFSGVEYSTSDISPFSGCILCCHVQADGEPLCCKQDWQNIVICVLLFP